MKGGRWGVIEITGVWKRDVLKGQVRSSAHAHLSKCCVSASTCCNCHDINFWKGQPGFANFVDEWSHCDFCFTNFGVILEYLESSIRLSSTWSWHVYTIVRDTRSSCGGPLTWKAQTHDGGHQVNFDCNLPSSCFVVQYNCLILMI